MFTPMRWLRKVVVGLSLVLLLSAAPGICTDGLAAQAAGPGVLGECGDGGCGYVAR